MSSPIFERIDSAIKSNPVMLYMKGTPQQPLCGFSAQVVQILNSYKVPFQAENVLADPELREAIKVYSNWPTIPQLYIRGEFIGGCDIVSEMHRKGELAGKLNQE